MILANGMGESILSWNSKIFLDLYEKQSAIQILRFYKLQLKGYKMGQTLATQVGGVQDAFDTVH